MYDDLPTLACTRHTLVINASEIPLQRYVNYFYAVHEPEPILEENLCVAF
jgi:hypothetical protein